MKVLLCLVVTLCSYFTFFSQSDQKTDIVFKTNGNQLKGSVIEVTKPEYIAAFIKIINHAALQEFSYPERT